MVSRFIKSISGIWGQSSPVVEAENEGGQQHGSTALNKAKSAPTDTEDEEDTETNDELESESDFDELSIDEDMSLEKDTNHKLVGDEIPITATPPPEGPPKPKPLTKTVVHELPINTKITSGVPDTPIKMSLRKKERSGSDQPVSRIPYQMGQVFSQLSDGYRDLSLNGPTVILNVDSYSDIPYRAISRGQQRPNTSSEKLLYKVSEIKPYENLMRPSTTPEFLQTSKMENNNFRSRSPSLSARNPSKSRSRSRNRIPRNDISLADDKLTSISRAAFGRASRNLTSVPEIKETSRTSSPFEFGKSESRTFQHLQESVNSIIAEEDEEFRERYSKWIAEWFHSQLSKMKEKLTQQFVQKLSDLSSEKEEEIEDIHTKYKEKIKSFESASTKFHQWVDALEEENRQSIRSKDSIISQMRLQLENSNQNLGIELDRQRILLKAEAEHKKMELISRHEETIQKLMETLKPTSNPVLEGQLESLQHKVSHLQNENDILKSKLHSSSAYLNELSSKPSLSASASASAFEAERKSLSKIIDELQKKTKEIEQEKSALAELLAEKTAYLAANSAQSVLDVTKRLQKANEAIFNMKKKHEKEVRNLKASMQNQETKYNKTFVELKHKYGDKIDNLSKTIDKLQVDLK